MADRGVAMVVMGREEYIRKAENLSNVPTYKITYADPIIKQKDKLINPLKNIKTEGGINDTTYGRMYPTGAGSPKFYGLPKIHKVGIHLRHIVSSRGSFL